MSEERFRELAGKLAERDREIADGLARATHAAQALRERAEARVHAFCDEARARGAEHLADVSVTGVEPDEKHVDCVQFAARRGRHQLTCVAKAAGKITLVGPFRIGGPEKPCSDQPLEGPELEAALDDALLRLLEQASRR